MGEMSLQTVIDYHAWFDRDLRSTFSLKRTCSIGLCLPWILCSVFYIPIHAQFIQFQSCAFCLHSTHSLAVSRYLAQNTVDMKLSKTIIFHFSGFEVRYYPQFSVSLWSFVWRHLGQSGRKKQQRLVYKRHFTELPHDNFWVLWEFLF